MEQNTESSLFGLQVDHHVSDYLGETARWAKFLAVLGFIFCGIFVVAAVFAGSLSAALGRSTGVNPGFMGAAISFFYIVSALLTFLPCLYMYRFASRMQVALRNSDQEQLTQSFRYLKSWFRFLGILTIIYLGLLLLFLLASMFGALSPRV